MIRRKLLILTAVLFLSPAINDFEGEQTLKVFLQLRVDTIDRIARYDPEFAFDFLKTTEPPYEQMQFGRDRERALAVRLAKQVIDKNPDLALKLGRIALDKGFPRNSSQSCWCDFDRAVDPSRAIRKS